MSESSVGVSLAVTRQNAGKPPYVRATSSADGAPPPDATGGMNSPAATDSARVTLTLGSMREVKLSHDAVAAPTDSASAGAGAREQAAPMSTATVAANMAAWVDTHRRSASVVKKHPDWAFGSSRMGLSF
jgi:hypothetical protein